MSLSSFTLTITVDPAGTLSLELVSLLRSATLISKMLMDELPDKVIDPYPSGIAEPLAGKLAMASESPRK
ncbi:hypothetical protein D3C78_1646720 [compost metagenome]